MADPVRTAQWGIELASVNVATARVSQWVIEYATPTYTQTRVSQWIIELAVGMPNPVRITQYIIEYISIYNPIVPVTGAPGCVLGVPSAVTGLDGCSSAVGELA